MVTMEDQVVSPVAQSNQAVSLIKNKRYNDAVEVLSHALARLSNYLRGTNNTDDDEQDTLH